MQLPRLVWVGIALGFAVGCGEDEPPPQAPTELDDLVHYFLQEIDGDDAASMGAAADNLEAWYDASDEVVDGLYQGQVTDLSSEEVAQLEGMLWQPDPAPATGVVILFELDCSLEEVVEITLEPDQLGLFPGNYVAYERFFDSDPDCFAAEQCDQVDWHSEIEDSFELFNVTYGLITRLKRFWGGDSADEPVVLARNFMPEAAAEDVDGAGFEQSYHIETFVPRGTGGTLHLYALWNHGFLEDIPDDVPFWAEQYVEGLVDWDERIQELCVEGP